MPPAAASGFSRPIHETKLKAMVFCRGIAVLLGYPVPHDPTFTNHHLLGLFLTALLSHATSATLWDFTPLDLTTIFSPLLDYADLILALHSGKSCSASPLLALDPSSLEATQRFGLTMAEAQGIAAELDALTSGTGDVWGKWFAFVRYAELVNTEACQLKSEVWYPWLRTRLIGMIMMRPMEEVVAALQFFTTCRKLHTVLPANDQFREHIISAFSASSASTPQKALKPIGYEMTRQSDPQERAQLKHELKQELKHELHRKLTHHLQGEDEKKMKTTPQEPEQWRKKSNNRPSDSSPGYATNRPSHATGTYKRTFSSNINSYISDAPKTSWRTEHEAKAEAVAVAETPSKVMRISQRMSELFEGSTPEEKGEWKGKGKGGRHGGGSGRW